MRVVLLLLGALGVAVRGEQCIGAGLFNDQFNKCYHFVTSPQTYAEAVEVCKGFGGLLVCIHSAFENALVYGSGKQHFDSDYWIGLSDLDEPNVWVWADEQSSAYAYWDSGYPVNDTSLRCVAADTKTGGRWRNVECDAAKKNFVCQVPTAADSPNTECPGGGPAYNGRNCFYFVDSLEGRDHAAATCASFQGLLASVETEDKQTFFYDAARSKILRGDYWIGLTMNSTNSKWQWSDSAKFQYNNWETGFPITDADMNCGAVRAEDGKWYNTFCQENPHAFACEVISPIAPPTTPPPSTTTAPIDPDGWNYFGPTNSYYKMLHWADYDYMDWEDVRDSCFWLDGDLASIHSEEEDKFLAHLVDVASDAWVSWIGLESDDGEAWYWSDGSPLDYQAWSSGVPIDDPEALCAVLYAGAYWDNFDCNRDDFSAICKRSGDEAERARLRKRREKRREEKKLRKLQKKPLKPFRKHKHPKKH